MSTSAPQADVYINDRRMPLLNMAQGGYGNLRGGGYGTPPPPVPPQTPSPATTPPLTPSRVAPPPNAPELPGRSGGSFGQRFDNNASQTAVNGTANQLQLQFALPKDLDTSRVRIKIVLTEGKVRETVEKELSVVPSRLSIDCFPEGGELIAGVPNRVYYRVRTPHGESVNPEGRVIVLSGSDVLLDSAPGAGTGTFTFTPAVGETYSVRITKPGSDPIEIADPFARVGGVRQDGLVLHAPRPVAAEGEPVDVVLRNPAPHGACCWSRSAAAASSASNGSRPTAPKRGWRWASCPPRGLVRLTAYDTGAGMLRPLAERLIYRTPALRLDLSVLHLGGVIAPKYGQKSVQLQVRCRNEAGESENAWGVVSIVDDSVHGREANPLAHFFIAGDVQDGESLDNAALLAADNPAAQQALDLFLGTVGWRRFQPARGDAKAGGAPVDAAFVGRENASPRNLQAQLEAKVEETLTPLRLAMQQKHCAAERRTAKRRGRACRRHGRGQRFRGAAHGVSSHRAGIGDAHAAGARLPEPGDRRVAAGAPALGDAVVRRLLRMPDGVPDWHHSAGAVGAGNGPPCGVRPHGQARAAARMARRPGPDGACAARPADGAAGTGPHALGRTP